MIDFSRVRYFCNIIRNVISLISIKCCIQFLLCFWNVSLHQPAKKYYKIIKLQGKFKKGNSIKTDHNQPTERVQNSSHIPANEVHAIWQEWNFVHDRTKYDLLSPIKEIIWKYTKIQSFDKLCFNLLIYKKVIKRQWWNIFNQL